MTRRPAVDPHSQSTPADLTVRCDDIAFETSDLAEDQSSGDALDVLAMPRRFRGPFPRYLQVARSVRSLPLVLALIIGITVGLVARGPLAAALSHVQSTTALPRTPAANQTDHPIGCPTGHPCRAQHIAVPIVTRLLRLYFPDALVTDLIATDDAMETRQYRLQLTATLARGLTLQVIAGNVSGTPASPTPWTFVAVGDDARPDHAERTIPGVRDPDSSVRIRLAVSGVATQRPGKSDAKCEWCGPDSSRSQDAEKIRRQIARSQPAMVALIAEGLESVAHSQAATWLG